MWRMWQIEMLQDFGHQERKRRNDGVSSCRNMDVAGLNMWSWTGTHGENVKNDMT